VILTEGRQTAALAVEPVALPPIAFFERLSTFELDGVEARPITLAGDSPTSDAIALAATGDDPIHPVELSFALRIAAAPSLKDYQPDSGPSPYGRDDIFGGFAAGLAPREFPRSWQSLEPWKEFLEEREKALLYQP
jgi:hypothetical protein